MIVAVINNHTGGIVAVLKGHQSSLLPSPKRVVDKIELGDAQINLGTHSVKVKIYFGNLCWEVDAENYSFIYKG